MTVSHLAWECHGNPQHQVKDMSVDKNKRCLQFPSISIKLISSFFVPKVHPFFIFIVWLLNEQHHFNPLNTQCFFKQLPFARLPAKKMWPVMNSHPTISPVNKNDWRAVNLLKLELVTALNSPFLLLLNPVLPILQRVKYLSCLFHNAEQ